MESGTALGRTRSGEKVADRFGGGGLTCLGDLGSVGRFRHGWGTGGLLQKKAWPLRIEARGGEKRRGKKITIPAAKADPAVTRNWPKQKQYPDKKIKSSDLSTPTSTPTAMRAQARGLKEHTLKNGTKQVGDLSKEGAKKYGITKASQRRWGEARDSDVPSLPGPHVNRVGKQNTKRTR